MGEGPRRRGVRAMEANLGGRGISVVTIMVRIAGVSEVEFLPEVSQVDT